MLNNILSLNEKCTGCRLCENVCPHQAIVFTEDSFHFYYPTIDNNKCVDCGLCLKKCPLMGEGKVLHQKSFLFINQNRFELSKSASGGAFIKLAKYVISRSGIVYGAAWTDELQVKHVRAVTEIDLERIQKSKYIQSVIGKDVFCSIKSDVASGKLVLFSGTPCQCAAISSLFSKKPENLILSDIVCHGVPNQWAFDQCIKAFESLKHCIVTSFSFRYKDSFNCYNKRFSFTTKDKKRTAQYTGDYRYFPYYNAFHNYKIFRKSCYCCNFRGSHRLSDLTFGDFWGLKHLDTTFDNGYDKSLIISNSVLGDALIRDCFSNAKQTDFDKSISHNHGYLYDCDILDYSFYKKCESINKLKKDFVDVINKKRITRFKNGIKRIFNKIGFKFKLSYVDFSCDKPIVSLDLKQMQFTVEKMFKEVIAICNRHSIKYYCQAGTVLGAIRHGGPIPWDYDVDIIVPNNRIDELCQFLQTELSAIFYVDYFKSMRTSMRQFPRIGLKGFSTDTLHLDIFRLIGLPDDRKNQIKLVKKFNNLTLNVVRSRNSIFNLLRYKYYKVLVCRIFFGKRYYLRKFDKLSKKYNYETSLYVMNPSGKYKEKNIFKKEIYGDGKTVRYSDFEVIVPSSTDFYLRQYYGDYNTTPSSDYIDRMMNDFFKIR